MKKIFLTLSLATLILASCNEKPIIQDSDKPVVGQGTLNLALAPVAPIVITTGSSPKASRVAQNEIDMSKFSLVLKNSKNEIVATYPSYIQLTPELLLGAGTYNISAQNDGVVNGAAFDKPLYAGSQDFIIQVGSSTTVKLSCEVKSTGIQVDYSKAMLSKLDNIDVTVSIKNNGSLHFGVGQERVGWYSVPSDGIITVYVSARNKITGDYVNQKQDIPNVKAKELRRVGLDVKTSGSAVIDITIDSEVTIKDVTVSVPDADDIIDNNGDGGSWDEGGENPDPDPIAPPTVIGASHNGSPFDIDNDLLIIDRYNENNILDVMIASTASAGIGDLFLTIDSPSLTELLESQYGMVGEVNLTNPPSEDPGWVALFSDPTVGIIDPQNPITGKKSHTFSVGGLMVLLGIVDTTGGVTHNFTLRVVDANGATTKTLRIQLSAPQP